MSSVNQGHVGRGSFIVGSPPSIAGLREELKVLTRIYFDLCNYNRFFIPKSRWFCGFTPLPPGNYCGRQGKSAV
jgi:hypothetical protein